jgi:hypothetical protein
MPRAQSPNGDTRVDEPSPPFEHVSWYEETPHDAAEDMAVLAETVMGRDGASARSRRVPNYLAQIAEYPVWAVMVRALVGAAVFVVPAFVYAGTRYHYLVRVGGQNEFDQNALLDGLALTVVGSLVGILVGALWGLLVVQYARTSVRKSNEQAGDGRGGGR